MGIEQTIATEAWKAIHRLRDEGIAKIDSHAIRIENGVARVLITKSTFITDSRKVVSIPLELDKEDSETNQIEVALTKILEVICEGEKIEVDYWPTYEFIITVKGKGCPKCGHGCDDVIGTYHIGSSS